MTGRYCKTCGCVHFGDVTCAQARADDHRTKKRMREMLKGPTNIIVQDDEHFCLAGKVYPGLNGGRPMESKKAFNDELKAKGLVHSSPREMRDGPAKKNDVLLGEQIQETYGIPAHEARQYARDAIAGRV
jgi:hypothetical protein